MFGHEHMSALTEQYGVTLKLSGHLHIQHIARSGNLADAALGAFCIWPHRYAMVTYSDAQNLRYEACALDARFLPESFLSLSQDWFTGIARDKLKASLTGSEAEISLMADYAARFNLAYFSGTYRRDDPSWREDPAWALWQSQTDSAFGRYLETVMSEAAGDHLLWTE